MRHPIFTFVILAIALVSVCAQDADSAILPVHQTPDEDGIYYAGPEVTSPVLERTFYVPYPEGVSGKKIEGMTVLGMVITPAGIPDHIQILHSNGEFCDQASIATVKRSVFLPGKMTDKTVPVWIDIRVIFHADLSNAVPQVMIAERDLPVPDESKFEDKRGKPLPYTAPIPIHTVDADFPNPFPAHPYVEVAVVSVLVGVDGLPKEVNIVRGLGFGLDKKATAAVWHYRFLPATEKGKPIAARRDLLIRFTKF